MYMTVSIATSNKMTCKQCGKNFSKGEVYTIIYTNTKVQPRYCTECLIQHLAQVVSARAEGKINTSKSEEIEVVLRDALVESLI